MSAFDDPSVQASRGSERVNPFDDIESGNYSTGHAAPQGRIASSSVVDTPRQTSGSVARSVNRPPPPTSPPSRRKGWSLRICTFWRIPIYIHFTFPLIFVIDLINSIRFSDSFIAMCMFLILDSILFFSVLLHELGHCAAARMVGGEVDSILLWPLGGLAYVGHSGGSKKDALIAFAGPLTHLPQVLIWGFILAAAYSFDDVGLWYLPLKPFFGRNIVAGAFFMQLLVMLFNLLIPAFPLDGGRIFANLLIQKYDLKTTAKIMVFISAPIGVGIAIYGGIESWMLTILLGAWIVYQAIVLWQHASDNTLNKHPLFLSPEIGKDAPPPLSTQAEPSSAEPASS